MARYAAGYTGPMVPAAGKRPKGPEIGFPIRPKPPAPKPEPRTEADKVNKFKALPAGAVNLRGAVTGRAGVGPSRGPEIGFPVKPKPPVVAMKKGGVVAKKAAPKKAGSAVKQKR